MNRRPWRALAAVCTLLAAAALAAALVASAAGGTVLVVTDADGEELVVHPVDDGTEVDLEYTHSVEKTLVTDVYVVRDRALVTERMEFSSYGAGLPSEAEVTRRDGRFVYDPPEQRTERLSVKTGHVAGHELVVDGERYALADRADGGTVYLTVERRFTE